MANRPSSRDDKLIKAYDDSIKVLGKNTKSLDNLAKSFDGNFDAVANLTTAFQRSEKLALKSLSIGTTYSKFVEANSAALDKSTLSQQSMTNYLLTGFDRGIRDLGDETINLIDEMHLSNQNAEALLSAQSKVSLLTGGSIDIQDKLSKTLRDTNKDYGVSTDRLVDTLNSLGEAMRSQSIYGEQAVESIGELGIILKGGMAGKEGADQMIQQLLSIGGALDVVPQELLGLRELFKDVRAGTGTSEEKLEMLIKAGDDLRETFKNSSDEAKDALTRVIGQPLVTSLLAVSQTLKDSDKTAEQFKASEEQYRQTMKGFEEDKMEFYGKLAPEIHMQIAKFLPMIAVGRAAGHAANAIGMQVATSPLGGAGAMRFGKGLMSAGALLTGPIGIGLTALTMSMPLLVDLFKGNKSNTDVLRKEAEEKARKDRIAKLSTEASLVASVVRGMVMNNPTKDEMRKVSGLLEKLIVAQKNANKAKTDL